MLGIPKVNIFEEITYRIAAANEIIEDIKGCSLEDPEWIVLSAMIAAEVNTEARIESVKDRIEKEWAEITTIALRESIE